MKEVAKKIGLFSFTMIVVSLVIGMGIFKTGTDSAKMALSPAMYFGAWIVGGIIAFCGALTYAEIGSRLPITGGYYKIFTYAYHPSVAFTINVIILISNAASLAVVALIGAEYLQGAFFPNTGQSFTVLVSIGSILLFYGVNLLGFRMSAGAQTVLMLFKIGLLVFLISALFFAPTKATNPSFFSSTDSGFLAMLKAFGLAMVSVSFTYGGYQQTINFGNEVANANKNVPKGILFGIIIIISIYLLVNLSYYTVVGFDWMQKREGTQQVAFEVVKKFLDENAAKIFSGLLFFSVLTYVNALLLSNPRVMYAMSEDGVLPKIFAIKRGKKEVLVNALTAFTILCLAILSNGKKIDDLLSFSIFLDCFGMILSAATLFKLRKTTTHLDDTGIYKMKFFPLATAVFIVAYIFIACSIIINRSREAVTAFVVIAFTLAVYYIMQQLKNHNKPN
jgi:APA family basic amino acid/polyamine antiporter